MKIYTRTGDKGTTSLFSGERVDKTDERVEAYGHIDELNAAIGALAAFLPETLADIDDDLQRIQRLLFQAASWLATVPGSEATRRLTVIRQEDIDRLEADIDRMQAVMPDLTGFILPGGSRPAALAHVARTVCRRAERRLIACTRDLPDNDTTVPIRRILVLINRLSDYLFVIARFINHRSDRSDTLWKDEPKPIPEVTGAGDC